MDWIKYKKIVKTVKQLFLENKIQEIALSNKRLWNLINWVKKHKLSAMEVINFNECPCDELDKLWQALHNTAQNKLINLQLLDEIPLHQQAE